MPNWCQNDIQFHHESKEMLDKLEEAIHLNKTLELLRPFPKDIEIDNDWCVENWGTKWELCHFEHVNRIDDNNLMARAESAWSPPIQAFEYAEKNGWRIDAVFFEAGACYAGSFTGGKADYIDVDNTLHRIITAGFSPNF